MLPRLLSVVRPVTVEAVEALGEELHAARLFSPSIETAADKLIRRRAS